MSDNKKYHWLKLKNDFFRQREIKKLRKIAGGDTFTIIYLKMQLLSIKSDGVITFERTEERFDEQLSIELDEELENVKLTMAFLFSNGLIESITEDDFLLNKVPGMIGSESDSAERVRRLREREKGKLALHCNDQVTKSNTEIEKELDIEIEKEIKKKTKTETKTLIVSPSSRLDYALIDFIEFRKSIKKPIATEKALDLIKQNLQSMASTEQEQIDILNQSIMNGWQGIFELKNKSTKKDAFLEQAERMKNW